MFTFFNANYFLFYFRVPGITIATDIICGFPTETEANFEETLALINKYHFPVLFINQFYPRPGTPAAKMKRVPTQEVKRRSKAASDIFNSYGPYEGRVGKRYRILITEEAADGKHFVGHNKFYEQILVDKDAQGVTMGSSLDVEIVSIGKYSMIGRPMFTGLWSSIITSILPPEDDHQRHQTVLLSASTFLLATAILYRGYRHFS